MKLIAFILIPLAFAFAHSHKETKLELKGAHIRFVPKGREVSAAFVKIKNTSKHDVTITAIKSDRFEDIELHTHKIIEGVMKMRQVDSMKVEAGKERILKSKSDHIMFFGFKKELTLGEKIPLTLVFKDKSEETHIFEVKK